MTAFQEAYATERATHAAATHVFALEWRTNRRFRLWERSADDPLIAKLDARIACRHDLRHAHEDAQFRLEEVLHRASVDLPAQHVIDEPMAMCRDCDRQSPQAWDAAFAAVLRGWQSLGAW